MPAASSNLSATNANTFATSNYSNSSAVQTEFNFNIDAIGKVYNSGKRINSKGSEEARKRADAANIRNAL